MATTAATVPAKSSEHVASLDAYDAILARALCGRASFAELIVLLHVADVEMRRSDARIRRAA